MNPLDIHIITRLDDLTGEVKVVTANTEYEFVEQEYELFNSLDNDSGRFSLVTIRLPEILFTGDEELLDLMPEATDTV